MRKVCGNIWIGNARDARDLNALYEHSIEAVVDVALEETPAVLSRGMVYLRFPIMDGADKSESIIGSAVQCVGELIRQDVRVLVACGAGMSRSVAITAGALSLVTGRSPEECLADVSANRPHDVSSGLWNAVRRCVESRSK